MGIDIGKMNLSERDSEDWLYANPTAIRMWSDGYIARWIGRQYKLPSGIADLIGVGNHGHIVVVEVKNVPIDSRAITQVCRYAADIECILNHRAHYQWNDYQQGPYVPKIVIGPSVESRNTTLEADACRVWLRKLAITLNVETGIFYDDHDDLGAEAFDYNDKVKSIASRSEWDVAGPFGSRYAVQMQESDEQRWQSFKDEMAAETGDVEHF